VEEIKLLDVVALLEDVPEENLQRGEVGTVVEVFEPTEDAPAGFLVEFSDRQGRAYAVADLPPDQLIRLRYRGDVRDAA
jgi:Domain of unknown function (DUF4926)